MGHERVRTMEELASVSGISRPTLSKFFNDPTSVRASTRQRIETALERYDYVPNVYAINQNRNLTRNIGIIVPFLADPFFAEVARNIELMCGAAGYNPILLSSHGDPDREIRNLDSLRGIKPAGVLLAPLGRRSRADALHAFCQDVPTVLFDCDVDGVGDAMFGTDHFQSTGMITEYLARTGEPPALFEIRNAPNPNANRRRSAYEQAMRRLGHEPILMVVEGEGWAFEEIAHREAGRIFGARSLPSNTILCSNDRLAIGVLAAAYEHGLRVGVGEGHALRVAGHDDHPFSRFTCPSLTTVSQDYDQIAGQSLDRLISIIGEGARPDTKATTLFDGALEMRSSA
ncbi:LacI family DNA-binding transcriptional regulator [Pseudoponticoccus marisrubri]|uniref:LacI family transcriptional regulator n=1 Tax=Pseudoponticoccus marisrubri TaxID=1685382 RepID=A0A0W7WDS8_9RHOB|nr:LacI family DNA-binding transcriptional regulator [Pseudoponticoccus marisrubri]KUF08717.1 LacI family transcriptional regulator [Pseudoponticoccus marisrubri]